MDFIYIVYALAVYGAYVGWNKLMTTDFFGIEERRRNRPRQYPPLPFIPALPGCRVSVSDPADGTTELVTVEDVSFRAGTEVPEMLYFTGKSGPGLCHALQARLVALAAGQQFRFEQLVRPIWAGSPIVRFLYTVPHTEPHAVVAMCRDLDGRLQPYLHTQLCAAGR